VLNRHLLRDRYLSFNVFLGIEFIHIDLAIALGIKNGCLTLLHLLHVELTREDLAICHHDLPKAMLPAILELTQLIGPPRGLCEFIL
jgi:hypothetical protein